MSAMVERPSICTTPRIEETFDELCDEWLQFESSPRLAPQQPAVTSAYLPSNEETNLWLDIQQWSLPISPRLIVSDVQSPGALRPYGTPLATEVLTPRPNDCYFSFQPYSEHNIPTEAAINTIEHQFEPEFNHESSLIGDLNADQLSFGEELLQIESASTSNFSSEHNSDYAVELPSEPNHKKRKISVDDPIRIKYFGQSTSQGGGMMIEWGKAQQGRSRMDNKRKQEYRNTRRQGACENCRRGRRRCDRSCMPYVECLTTKPLNFLDRPVDARLFRLRPSVGYHLASEKLEIYTLAEVGLPMAYTMTNHLSQGIPGAILPIEICTFAPHPHLRTSHVYTTLSRGRQVLEMPNYCLANVSATMAALKAYVHKSWYLYLQDIMLKVDKISQDVLRHALTYTVNHPERSACLVHRALMLLAVNRMIEHNWTFAGEQVPGIPTVQDPENPWFAQRPITPVMDTQLDQIIIQTILTPLRENLLADLQDKMQRGRKKDAFEIFLAVFILQTNTALLLNHSHQNAIRCGAGRRYNSTKLAEEYIHSSNILLAHFHHGCNGFARHLRAAGDGVLKSSSSLAPEHEGFLNRLVPEVHARKDSLMLLRQSKAYEADLFWAHQLFFDKWVPEDRTVCEL